MNKKKVYIITVFILLLILVSSIWYMRQPMSTKDGSAIVLGKMVSGETVFKFKENCSSKPSFTLTNSIL